MNIGEACAIFDQIESDKYTDIEKLIAIDYVVHLKSHNGVTKDEILRAFKWFLDSEAPVIQNSWIPVSERLPEDEKMCLVTLKKTVGIPEKMMSIANYLVFPDGGHWCDMKYGYLGWDRYTDGRGGTMQYTVTAWMPLPEPYREKTDE